MFFGAFKSSTAAMGTQVQQYFQFPNGFEVTPYTQPCVTLNRNLALVQQAEGEKYGLHILMCNEGYKLRYNLLADEPVTDKRNGINLVTHDSKQVVPIGDGNAMHSSYHKFRHKKYNQEIASSISFKLHK